jgi:hypothetical protein
MSSTFAANPSTPEYRLAALTIRQGIAAVHGLRE